MSEKTSSGIGINLDLSKSYDLITRGEQFYHLIEGNHILFMIGATGAGKTTTLLWLSGKKLKADSKGEIVVDKVEETDIGQIGTAAKSQTLHINARKIGNLVYVDGAGNQDTEGPSVDLANVVSVNTVMQLCRTVLPVILVDYRIITVNRGDVFRKTCSYIHSMFKKNFAKAKPHLHIFFTHAGDATLDTLKDDVDSIVSAESVANTTDVTAILDFILDSIENGSSQVKILKPLEDTRGRDARGLKTYFEGAKPLENPKDVCSFALTPELQLHLANALNETKANIPIWVASGNINNILQQLKVLQKTSDKIETIKLEFNNCLGVFQNLITSKQNEVILRFNEVVDNLPLWVPGDIEKLNKYAKLVEKLTEAREFLPQEVYTTERLEEYVYKQIDNWLHNLERETSVVQMKLYLEKVTKLVSAIVLSGSSLEQFVGKAKQIIKKIVEESLVPLRTTNYFKGVTVEEIMVNLNQLIFSLEQAKEAAAHLKTSITELNFDQILKDALRDHNERESNLRNGLTQCVKELSKLEQVEPMSQQCLILKEISKHSRLIEFFPSFRSSWDSFKKFVEAYGKEQLRILQSSVTDKVDDVKPLVYKIKAITNIDIEIKYILGLELNQVVSSLETKVNAFLDQIENELDSTEKPNYDKIVRNYKAIYNSMWIDECGAGYGNIKEKLNNAKQSLISKLKFMESNINWNWKRNRYELVAQTFNQFDEMDKLGSILNDDYYSVKERCQSTLTDNILKELTIYEQKARFQKQSSADDNTDPLTFWEANQILIRLEALTLICTTLGLKKKETCEDTVKRYVDQYAKSIVDNIDEDCIAQLTALEQLSDASKLQHLQKLSVFFDRAKGKVHQMTADLERNCERDLLQNDFTRASKNFEKFAKAKILHFFFPDILQRISTLQEKLLKEKKENMDKIFAWLESGSFSSIKSEMTQFGKQSKEYGAIKNYVEGYLKNKINEVERNHIGITLVRSFQFNLTGFRVLQDKLQYLINADYHLSDLLDPSLKLSDKLNQFKQNLDRNFTQVITETTNRYLVDKQFADAHKLFEEIKMAANGFGLSDLPEASKAILFYDTESQNFWNKLTIDDPSTVNVLYDGLQKSQQLGYNNKKVLLEKAISDYTNNQLQAFAKLSYTDASASFELLKSKMSLIPQDLCKSVSTIVQQHEKRLQAGAANAITTFEEDLENGKIDNAKKQYEFARSSNDTDTLSKFTQLLKTSQTNIIRTFGKGVIELNADTIKQSYHSIKSLEIFPQISKLTDSADYKKLQQQCTQFIKVLGDSSFSPDKNFASNVIFLIQIIPINDSVPAIFDPSALRLALVPTISYINNVEDQFQKGIKSYDFVTVATALKERKQVDTCFVLNNLDLSAPCLTDFKLASERAKTFTVMKSETEKVLEELSKTATAHWDNQNFDEVTKILRSLSSLSALDGFVATLHFQQNTKNTINELYNTLLVAAQDSFQKNETEAFNKYLARLDKTKQIENLLNSKGSQQLLGEIDKKINTIVSEFTDKSDIASDCANLIELQKLSEEIPMSAKSVSAQTEKYLNKLNSTDVSKLVSQLEMQGRVGSDIIMKYPQFSSKQVKMWIQKTKGQGIEYALEHFKVREIEPPKVDSQPNLLQRMGLYVGNTVNALLGTASLLSDRHTYLTNYESFLADFKNTVEKNKTAGYPFFPLKSQIEREISRPCFESHSILAKIFALWSLTKSNVNMNQKGDNSPQFWLAPHPIQYLTLVRMLEKSNNKYQNQLIEILTGEGKSVVLGVTSLIFGLLGYDVHCICYSEYLSERDYKSFEKLFQIFGVKITYSTVYQMCNTIINKDGNVRELTTQFLRSNISGNKMPKAQEGKSILLIDEVDEFFGSSFLGNSYNPATLIQNDDSFELLKSVWRNRSGITKEQVQQSNPFTKLVAMFPEWKPLFIAEVSKMLQEVNLYNDNSPKIYQNKIGYALQDSISTKIVYGYKTTFAYFHYYETGDIAEKDLKENVGLYLGCGNFSFAEIPRKFDLIMGVSGTLQSLTEKEKALICSYGISRVAYAPSMYGQSRRVLEATDIIQDREQWLLRIVQTAQEKADAGRAVLIFFSDNETLQEFQAKHAASSFRKFQVLNEQTDFKDTVVQKATASGTVTFCTRPFGRGVDFICRDPTTKEKGGVAVIQTFIAVSEAESIQLQGRGARQGDPGSYKLILHEGSLAAINITPEESKQASADINKLLKERRDIVHDKSVDALLNKTKDVSKAHEITQEFHKALIQYSASPSPSGKSQVQSYILKLNQANVKVGAKFHLYFCLDDSGSMGGKPWNDLVYAVESCINKRINLCVSAGAVANDLVTIVNYSSNAQVMCRAVALANQPHKKTSFRSGGTDFSAGLKLVQQEIRSVTAGYTPALLFMSDGGCSNGESEIQSIANEFKSKGIQIFVIGFGTGCNAAKMQNMANISGGQYFYGSDGVNLVSAFEDISVKLTTNQLAL